VRKRYHLIPLAEIKSWHQPIDFSEYIPITMVLTINLTKAIHIHARTRQDRYRGFSSYPDATVARGKSITFISILTVRSKDSGTDRSVRRATSERSRKWGIFPTMSKRDDVSKFSKLPWVPRKSLAICERYSYIVIISLRKETRVSQIEPEIQDSSRDLGSRRRNSTSFAGSRRQGSFCRVGLRFRQTRLGERSDETTVRAYRRRTGGGGGRGPRGSKGRKSHVRRAYSRPLEHAIIRSRYRKYQWRNGSLIPRPAPCQCLSSTSFIFFILLLFFVIAPVPSLIVSVLLRGSAVCTRCSSSPDDYIDRVGGWVEARETVARYVVRLSPGRGEKREEKEGIYQARSGESRRIFSLFTVISTPIRTFIVQVTRTYGYMCHRYRITAA